MVASMMDRLPTELVALILELAATNDRETARSLCLVNQAVRKVAARVLYRHIFLSGTNQVRRFNATLKMSPKLGDLICGMTLHDEGINMLQSNFIYKLMYEEDPDEEWIPPWKTLIRYIGVLSRHHMLSELVVSTGAYRRLSYHREDGTMDGSRGHLSVQLKKSNIKLNHLVISHADMTFTNLYFTMKRLTWLGCELQMSMNSYGFNQVQSIRSDELEAVEFLLGPSFVQLHPSHKKLENITAGLTSECIPVLMEQMGKMFKVLAKAPHFSIRLHRNALEAKKHVVAQLACFKDYKVEVGQWGYPSDVDQRQAESEWFASRGWLQRAPRGVEKATSTAKTKNKGKNTGNSLKSHALWCGCLDMDSLAALAGND
jgi:hypothetical protein